MWNVLLKPGIFMGLAVKASMETIWQIDGGRTSLLSAGFRGVLYRVMDLGWQVRANGWIFYTSAEERGEIVTRIYYYSLSAEKFGQHCQE